MKKGKNMEQNNNNQSNNNGPMSMPPVNNQQMQQPGQQAKTNVMAILSLVFTFIFAPLGIIFGAIGLNQIKKTSEDGKGLAIAGLVTSSVFSLFWLLWLIFAIIAVLASSSAYN